MMNTMDKLLSLFSPGQRLGGRSLAVHAISTYLLDPEEILSIKTYSRLNPGPFVDHKECDLPYLGNNDSIKKGSGMDYDEQRLYQPGDDLRRINWRAAAKTGDMYTKLYIEEKRSVSTVMVDRRSGMWFGTRHQLKIKQAVSIAFYSLFQSLQQQKPVAGILFDGGIHGFSPGLQESALAPLMMALNRTSESVPSRAHSQVSASIEDVFKYALTTLPRGNDLIIISDFCDYTESHNELLLQLKQKFGLSIIQVLDSAELHLPKSGIYCFRSEPQSSELELDCSNEELYTGYHEMMREKIAVLKQHCDDGCIQFQQIFTNDRLFL